MKLCARTAVAISFVLLAAGMASAQSGPRRPDTPPDWLAKPTPLGLDSVWPAAAKKADVDGDAVIKCTVALTGLLRDCTVEKEAPAGYGFGAAAVALAPQLLFAPAVKNGVPVEAEVSLPIAFRRPRAPGKFDKAPDWLKKPTPQDLLTVWPVQAMKAGRGGVAIIQCIVAVTGGLRDCNVEQESPPGLGFGAAAIALTPQLLFKPAIRAGVPVEAEVNIPISFKITGGGFPSGQLNGPLQLTNVVWEEAPSYADLVAAYPAQARSDRLAGHASLQCSFNGVGRLRSCDVIREEPRGKGFGKAALQLAKKFKGPTRLSDGKAVEGDVTTVAFSFLPSALDGSFDLSKPLWARVPTFEEVSAIIANIRLPDQARVRLDCHVGGSGALTDCKVLDQTPPGQDLGPQALAMSADMRMALWADDGLPSIGAHVVVPIVFRTQSESKPAESAAAKQAP